MNRYGNPASVQEMIEVVFDVAVEDITNDGDGLHEGDVHEAADLYIKGLDIFDLIEAYEYIMDRKKKEQER